METQEKTSIRIKETSKSGTIAQVNGVFGKLSFGKFVPYTEEELAKKTAYKKSYGWAEYASLEEYKDYRNKFNAEREIRNAELSRQAEIRRQEETKRLMALIEAGPIPATVDNVELLLRYLNEQNWGSWTLPAMTIGYTALQHDCDGRTATTIALDERISDPERGIENECRFVVGAPRGYLNKYQRL